MNVERLKTCDDLTKAFYQWHGLIYSFIFFRVNDKESAKDILQEVFMKAWKYRATFDHRKSSLKNWLFAIAKNAIFAHYHQQEKHQTQNLSEQLADGQDLEKAIADHELIEYVFDKLNNLTVREQKILNLRYHQGNSIQEIADMLSMNNSAVKVAIHRAIKKLQIICNKQ